MAGRSSSGRRATGLTLPNFKVDSFGGLNTSEKNLDNIGRGVTPDSLNWVTGAALRSKKEGYYGDHIEMRRGTAFLKGSAVAGSNKVSGLAVATKKDGTQIPYFSVGRQVFYYDGASVYVEVGSNLLPAAAATDDVAFTPFQNLTDYYLVITSPNSSWYYITLSTPGTATDIVAGTYRGYLTQNQGRMILWNLGGATINTTDLYFSQTDSAAAPVVSAPNFVPPGSPVATSPTVFYQPGAGAFQGVVMLSGLYFCFHTYATYQITMTSNDATAATQQIYRQNVGIPYWRSVWPVSEGVIYIDTLNQASPRLRLLTINYATATTYEAGLPQSISDEIDLTSFTFNQGLVFEWGDYQIMEGKGQTNGVVDANNNVMFVRNKKTGYWNKLDYRASCFAVYKGSLIAGDSIAPNPLTLFSGFDDLGYNIPNYWKSAPMKLGWEGLKRFNRFVLKGLIAVSQNVEIWLAYDNGSFVKLDTIAGNGMYVQSGSPQAVGGQTLGSTIVGGGAVFAFPYEKEIQVASDNFVRVAVMFIGNSVGFLEVDSFEFKDIRIKSQRILTSQTQ